MAQIFHPSFNTLSRASLVGAIIVPALLVMGGTWISRSSYNTKVNIPLEQPIPFSHEHHAVELGIDCRYCHNGVEKSASAGYPSTQTCMSCHSQIWTQSPLLEPLRESWRTKTPLKWNRVNAVPDFVYFPHNIHINRGISCNNCHGPIQKMQLVYKAQPFQMRWCLNCHRNVENYVNKKEAVWDLYRDYQTGKVTPEEETLAEGETYHRNAEELETGRQLVKQLHVQKKQLTDCYTCHR